MNKIKIKNFTDVVTGGTPSTSKTEYWEKGDIPWLNSGELNQKIITTTRNYITKLGLEKSSSRLMCKDTVVMALTGSTTGVVGYLTFEACANQSVTGILPSSKHNSKYLYHYLNFIRPKVLNDAYGGAQPHISQGYVKELEIPLPTIATQQKIANILDKADELTQYNKQLIEKYDALTQSLFLDMFGDPIYNPKKWEEVKFSEVGQLDRGKSKHRPRNAPELLNGPYPLIQTGDVANSNGYINHYKATYSEFGLKQSKKWPKGTLCITIAANIAKTGILNFDACFPDSVVGFVPNEKTNNIYVQHWMSFLQSMIEEKAPMAAQKNINLAILKDLQFMKPSIKLQNEFAERVQLIDNQKQQSQETLEKSEALFESLVQKAFKGELY